MGTIRYIEAEGADWVVEAQAAPSLEEMQDFVDGYIAPKVVYPNGMGDPCTMIVNEEAGMMPDRFSINQGASEIVWRAEAGHPPILGNAIVLYGLELE